MNNNLKNIFGASLSALAFSLFSTSVAATCAVPPDCNALGFTQTSGDCAGKTMLKCPFNQSQVYCPSSKESEKAYSLGDTYIKDGVPIGKVIDLNGCTPGGSGSGGGIITVAQCIKNSGCPSVDWRSVSGGYMWTCNGSNAEIATSTTTNKSDAAKSCNYANGGCSHGTISTTGARSGTPVQATAGCEAMNAGGLTWYLPNKDQYAAIWKYVGSWSGNNYGNGNQYYNSCDGSCYGYSSSPTTVYGYHCVAAF